MKSKIFPVYIEFLDHSSNASWMNKEELDNFGAVTVYQMGWLVEETKEVYKIAGQLSADGSVGDTIAILKGDVKVFRRMRIPKKVNKQKCRMI